MREFLRSLAADGRAVLVSSHLMGELQDTADHLVVVGRGRVLADTTVPGLVARHSSLEQAYLSLTRGEVEFNLKELPLAPWHGLGVLALWAGVTLVAGAALLHRRDA